MSQRIGNKAKRSDAGNLHLKSGKLPLALIITSDGNTNRNNKNEECAKIKGVGSSDAQKSGVSEAT